MARLAGRVGMFPKLDTDGPATGDDARVAAIVRERYALAQDDTVQVTEAVTTLPGFPPVETVIAFWTDRPDRSTQRHHCKVFKPAAQVVADDLPPGWMRDALAVAPNFACDCC